MTDNSANLSLITSSRKIKLADDTTSLNQVNATGRRVGSAHSVLDAKIASRGTHPPGAQLVDDNSLDESIHLVDTHCHIHDPEFKFNNPSETLGDARMAGVSKILVVGTSVDDSLLAAEFALKYENVFAIIGSHPHEAKRDLPKLNQLEDIIRNLKFKGSIVGIGEIGLDYYYQNSPRGNQFESLRYQLHLADKYNFPVSFHVREAFDDFWLIYDEFKPRGVLHSFTDSPANMNRGLERGLLFGINGISTFTKNSAQLEMFNNIPLESIVLETDAPFLTPKPYRGKINSPAYVKLVAEDISSKRCLSLADVASITTANACFLFGLN